MNSIKYIWLMILTGITVSCSENITNTNNRMLKDDCQTMSYRSMDRSLPYIDMELRNNKRFIMRTRNPGAEEDPKVYIGKWSETDKYFELRFSFFKKPDLHTLFPKQLKDHSSVEVINKRTFKFSKEENDLWIWGVYCSNNRQNF